MRRTVGIISIAILLVLTTIPCLADGFSIETRSTWKGPLVSFSKDFFFPGFNLPCNVGAWTQQNNVDLVVGPKLWIFNPRIGLGITGGVDTASSALKVNVDPRVDFDLGFSPTILGINLTSYNLYQKNLTADSLDFAVSRDRFSLASFPYLGVFGHNTYAPGSGPGKGIQPFWGPFMELKHLGPVQWVRLSPTVNLRDFHQFIVFLWAGF